MDASNPKHQLSFESVEQLNSDEIPQHRTASLGRFVSTLAIDQAFIKHIPDPSHIQGNSSPWRQELFTGGPDRLQKLVGAPNMEGQGVVEPYEHAITGESIIQRSLTPSTTPYPPLPGVPPLTSNLSSSHTIARSRSGSNILGNTQGAQLRRAATMRLSTSRSSIADASRPKSAHSDADLTERESHSRTRGFEIGPKLAHFDSPMRRPLAKDTMTVPRSTTPPSRTRTPSKSSMRKLSSSSRSVTPVGDSWQSAGAGSLGEAWESAGPDTEDANSSLARPPRVPTQAAPVPYSSETNSPLSPYTAVVNNPQIPPNLQSVPRPPAHPRSTVTGRSRSRSVSTSRPGTPPPVPLPPPPAVELPTTSAMPISDEYIVEPYALSPATPPRPFARPPKTTSPGYVDPSGFPTPPSYPPVPSLVASGSTSTSTRSSAYTSPGASHSLSSTDLTALGVGLNRVANREDDIPLAYGEEDILENTSGLNSEKGPHRPMAYVSRENSESSIARLQFATNAAALSMDSGNAGNISLPWGERYASSTRSGSSYDGSPNPLSRVEPPKKMMSPVWRSVNETEDLDSSMDAEEPELGNSSYTSQRPRNGTVASSRSASVILTTSASEDETDADDYPDYPFHLPGVNEPDEDVRTAAVVVAEEGRGLIVHGECADVSSIDIQPGTTHLLLTSSTSPHSIPLLLTQSLPNISTTLLALDISANFLSALPPTLAACVQLTELNIANNPLRALPVWLSGLEKLHVMIADSTGIATIPPELVSLKALTILSVRRNKLMSLPAWLSYLPVLERLEVEGNPFQGPWKALLAPLMTTQRPAPSVQGSIPQSISVSSSSSYSDLNSLCVPGMSLYGESVYSHPPPTPASPNVQIPVSYPPNQGKFESDMHPMSPTSESMTNGSRKFLTEDEDHTIMPTRLAGQISYSSVPPLPISTTQITAPPVSPGPLTGASTSSFASSVNSGSQLPYISGSPTSPSQEDRQEPSPLHRAPTFSAAERRTPSPYLRPLSRTRTTPSRSRMSAGSANGSIATFVADQSHGGMRSRTSSAASQRPHTDYVSGRYEKSPTVEDSGYYGSVTEYSAFPKSAGSEWIAFEEERKKEMRRMRSADELRRALESVIGPSEPLAPTEDDDNGGEATETDRKPAFHVPDVPRIDMRPTLMQSRTTPEVETVLPPRPGARRFATLGASTELTGQATRVRPALTENLWDAGVEADAEPDNDEARKSRATSPSPLDEEARRPKSGRKWGFLKKMSMGRMRSDPVVQKISTPSSTRSPQTLPPGSQQAPQRLPIAPPSINTSSPTPKPRQPTSGEIGLLSAPSTSTLASSQPPSISSSRSLAPPSNSLSVPTNTRVARRRSFLPLDGPPALNIPIPRTSPFMPEALISPEVEESSKSTVPGVSHSSELLSPPNVTSSQESVESYTSDTRALRSVMAYLRDMADLGMANSVIPTQIPITPSTQQSESFEPRSRRPTVVENGRTPSEASLVSSSSSGLATTSRSDEQRSNTMSMATSESGGSGKSDEERKVKNDKSKRGLLLRETIETERTYVQGLQELLDIYIKPASQPVNTLGNAVAGTKETVIPPQERKMVFNGVDSLFSFHNQVFLPALEQAARPLLLSRPDADVTGELSTAAAEAVAMVFVSHAAFMRMYSTYINNFDNAVQRLKHWSHDHRRPNTPISPSSSTAHLAGMVLQQMAVAGAPTLRDEGAPPSGLQPLTNSQRKRIKQFLKRSRLNPKHSQINLEAYLLLPVQRIPRYRLLLEELVRCTPPKPDLPDDPLERALNEIQALANTMNEGKREAESRRRLVQWQSRIKGKFPSPLVQPHRRLIMDGVLQLTRVVRKSSLAFEVITPDGNKTSAQIECLAPEENPRSLVGVLCTDLLVLCKDSSNGQDQNGQVDLWAVLRMQTLAQPASIITGNTLRVVDNKAILYFTTPSTADALTWCRAINMNIPVNKA